MTVLMGSHMSDQSKKQVFKFNFSNTNNTDNSLSKSTSSSISPSPSTSQPITHPSTIVPSTATRSINAQQQYDQLCITDSYNNQHTIRKVVQLGNNSALSSIVATNDVQHGIYEGGFKVWESSIDLCQLLYDIQYSCTNKCKLRNIENNIHNTILKRLCSIDISQCNVLELGCGHALPSIVCAQYQSKHTTVQDLNVEVLQHVTIDNFISNQCSNNNISYISGQWNDQQLQQIINNSVHNNHYDIILTAETIYHLEYIPALLSLILSTLSTDGICFIAAKRFYFGVGGSTTELLYRINNNELYEHICADVIRVIDDRKSTIREIIAIAYK